MNIRDEANAYKPAKLKNISDLNSVFVTQEVLEEAEVEYPYKYILVEGERYKVPVSVIAALKELIAANPKLQSFKVKQTGEGIKVKYLVIPLN
jgi:endo-1,4-beta-D-glucanase Y